MFTGIVRERGRVAGIDGSAAGVRLRISAPATAAGVALGDSVSIGGVCLTVVTVAGLDADGFAVALIPHTLAETTFGALTPGDGVNLEVDILAKYVERLLPSTMSR